MLKLFNIDERHEKKFEETVMEYFKIVKKIAYEQSVLENYENKFFDSDILRIIPELQYPSKETDYQHQRIQIKINGMRIYAQSLATDIADFIYIGNSEIEEVM